MVDRTRLESGRTLTGTVSSNLPLSASFSPLESIFCICSTLAVADLLLFIRCRAVWRSHSGALGSML